MSAPFHDPVSEAWTRVRQRPRNTPWYDLPNKEITTEFYNELRAIDRQNAEAKRAEAAP